MKTISDHILDILQNSVRAGATLIEIIVCEDKTSDIYAVEIKDNGRGMTKKEAEKALQPFFTTRTTRKIGLGLPLFKQNTEMTGGNFSVKSEPGEGTVVRAEFTLSHIDKPPMGDIAGVIALSAIGHPGVSFIYEHSTGEGNFRLSTDEINQILDGMPIQTPEVRRAVIELIENNLSEINAME